MGALLDWLDRGLNRDDTPFHQRKIAGVGALALLLLVSGVLATAAEAAFARALPHPLALLLTGALASSCLAQRSLHDHVRAVADALERDGLEAGRRSVSMIVGRDTASLDEAGICRAAIESLAENFADGIVAPAVWLALLGLPGGVLYKAVNTADSMIGHRTPRHLAFGWAAARLDDVVNWPAARLAALWIVAAAALSRTTSPREAWRVMRRDSAGHPSPNAGWPEAAMAGALGVQLGGARSYAGQRVEDRGIGDGSTPADVSMIRRALALYRTACALQFAAVVLLTVAVFRASR